MPRLENRIPECSGDLSTVLINCTVCVPLVASIPSICLLETSGRGISLQNLSEEKVDGDADQFLSRGGVG